MKIRKVFRYISPVNVKLFPSEQDFLVLNSLETKQSTSKVETIAEKLTKT